MSRPVPVKPDNFFVLLLNALRNRRVPIALRIVSHSLILLALAMLVFVWIMGLQLRQATAQQASAVGQSLQQQAVASATELMVANDLLSLNVMLDKLVQNPLVSYAAIYASDKRLIAEAGQRPQGSLPPLADNQSTFSAPIPREVAAAQLYLSLDMQQFRQPMTLSLQNMGLLAAIVLALALALSLRLGSRLSLPLLQLRLWLRDPVDVAPAIERQDEIGDLARQLQARLGPEIPEPAEIDPLAEGDDELFAALEDVLEERPPRKPAPAAAPAPAAVPPRAAARAPRGPIEPDFDLDFALDLDTESPPLAAKARPAAAAKPAATAVERPGARLAGDDFDLDADDLGLDLDFAELAAPLPLPVVHSAVLSIQLGAQEELHRLPRPRLLELLQRYRDCLAQASRLYHGQLHNLNDGGSLLLFHSDQPGEPYLTRALCCGELLRALGHALQVEIADSGLTLHLQLGLSHGDDLHGLDPAQLLQQPVCRSAIELGGHSRNLLLLDRDLSLDPQVRSQARIRAIAAPSGASCVERLQEPLPARLEQHLGQMLRPR